LIQTSISWIFQNITLSLWWCSLYYKKIHMESASLRQEVSWVSCHNWYSFFSMVVCNLSHRHWIVFPQERNVTVSQYRPRLWWLLHVSVVVLSVSIRTYIRYNFRLVFCNSYYFRLVYATVTISSMYWFMQQSQFQTGFWEIRCCYLYDIIILSVL